MHIVFIDGTWLFYSLLIGRSDFNRHDPLKAKYGEDWNRKYAVEWNRLPNIIADNIGEQLKRQGSLRQDVEIIRTSVFTSLRSDTPNGGIRDRMLRGFYQANYDVHQ